VTQWPPVVVHPATSRANLDDPDHAAFSLKLHGSFPSLPSIRGMIDRSCSSILGLVILHLPLVETGLVLGLGLDLVFMR